MVKVRSPSEAPLLLAAGAQFMIVLDASVVNLALPAMSAALHLSDGELSWVINAYILAFGGFLLVGGRVVDHVGPRRVFLGSVAVFTVASLSGGMAQTGSWLIAARAVQGLAAAAMAPATLAILTRVYGAGVARSRALAIWGAVSIAGGPVGSILGGTLAGSLGWNSVLLVNVPLGVFAVFAALRTIPRLSRTQSRRFDVRAGSAATAGLALLVYSLVNANGEGVLTGDPVTTAMVALALLVGFVALDRRVQDPLVPRSVLTASNVPAACVVGVLGGTQFYGIAFYVTLYLQQILGLSPLEAGLAFLPWGAAAIVSARAAAPVLTRLGVRWALVTGFVIAALGPAALTTVDSHGGYFTDVLPGLILVGIGNGIVGVATNVAALSSIPIDTAGVAAGLVTAAQEIGGALGLAALVAAYSVASGGADVAPGQLEVFAGLQAAYALGAIFAVVGAVASVTLVPGERAPVEQDGRTLDARGRPQDSNSTSERASASP